MSEDVLQDFRFEAGKSAKNLSEDARSVACVPVASRRRVVGAIYLARGSPAFRGCARLSRCPLRNLPQR